MSFYNSKHTKTMVIFFKKSNTKNPLRNYPSLDEAHNGYMMSSGAEI